MSKNAAFPRGAGGSILYPGTNVLLCGLAGKGEKWNDWEGSCERWDTEKGRMAVKLTNGEWKSLKPTNIRKVITGSLKAQSTGDANYDGIVAVFEKYDKDGNGILDMDEFTALLNGLGLGQRHLEAFLIKMDKSGDREVDYTEFSTWALSPMDESNNLRCEVYWPELMPHEAETAEEEEGEEHHKGDLTVEELSRLVGNLPAGWPTHGIRVVNNLRKRFPGYPLEGMVMFMAREDFIGGKVIAAIRATGAKEAEKAGATTVSGSLKEECASLLDDSHTRLPAEYTVRPGKTMKVYKEDDPNWSWENLRDDNDLACHVRWYQGDRFVLLDQCAPLGYDVLGVRQFGRVKYGSSPVESSNRYWVNLGRLVKVIDHSLQFDEAERV